MHLLKPSTLPCIDPWVISLLFYVAYLMQFIAYRWYIVHKLVSIIEIHRCISVVANVNSLASLSDSRLHVGFLGLLLIAVV